MVINSCNNTWLESKRKIIFSIEIFNSEFSNSVENYLQFDEDSRRRLSRNQKPPLVIRYPPQMFRLDFRESPLLQGFSARIIAAWVNMAVRTWGQEYKVIPEITGLLCQKITSGRGCQLAPWGSGPLLPPPPPPLLHLSALLYICSRFCGGITAVQPNNRSLLPIFFTEILFIQLVVKSNMLLF